MPGSTTAPTPNLPLVDKLVTGVQDLTKSVLPKCEANTITDIASLGCKACPEGSIAAVGAKACTACGRGQ
jgi:hypothetical protein